MTLERTLSDLVNQAYGLTPAEIDLMWQTAPPRMPIPPRSDLPRRIPTGFNTRLTSALSAAEAESNNRVYRLFDLTADEIKLLQKEVEY